MPPLSTTRTVQLPIRIWDLPTRLFHVALILLIAISYASVSLATDPATADVWLTIHLTSGYCMLALLVFRLAWGVFGSETARFATFLRSPLSGLRHLAQFGRREPDAVVGHNEAGGWMVLVMLTLIAIQVLTGLGVDGDGGPEGPLVRYLSKPATHLLFTIHAINFKLLLATIVLHVLAIAAYAVVKGHNLLRPMITGKKRLPAATRAPRMASPLLALGVLALSAALAWLVATRV